jgi:tetratricopeptide (TPR) repeat protein
MEELMRPRFPYRLVRRLTLTLGILWLAIGGSGVMAQRSDAPLAPELSGLGTIHMPVTTEVPKAQAFFDQGVRLLYGFNHQEARRAFQEAARLDPQLSMAHWGIALTLAPNLNAPMSAENGRAAYAAIQTARRSAARATARERALIAALAARFAARPESPRPPLDRAYAEAMARAAADHPGDADVQTLYADAVMNTMPWDYWQKDGAPKPATATISALLERVIAAHPDHAGAHHYYIHLWEASNTPERAEASADRLGALMPAAGHMVHMPAHIYLRTGRYADAAEANVRAIAADEDYLAQCQAQGLYPVSYYPHNLHFLWAAATFEGRSAVAVDAARQVAAKVPHHHAGAVAWTADFPVTPWLAYIRFGRWQQMLLEPKPPATDPYATGIWHYARALSLIGRGEPARAESELTALTVVLGHQAFRTTLKDSPLLVNLQIASRIVRGELAARARRFDEAIRLVSEAVALEDGIPYNEPPVWHQPPRQVLGALLLEAGRPKEAEEVYRADLTRFRENGWSLFGLWQSLGAQGRADEAQLVRARFDKAWARADVTLTASRVLIEEQRAAGGHAHESTGSR